MKALVNGMVRLSDGQESTITMEYDSLNEEGKIRPVHLRVTMKIERRALDGTVHKVDPSGLLSMEEMKEIVKQTAALDKEVKRVLEIESVVGSVESSAGDIESLVDNYRSGLSNIDEFRQEVESIIDDIRDIIS